MKKWSSLVLAAIVAMGTFAATGCIENLEPAGIEELRGAKAELLRAEAAYKQAQIALVEADAAYTQAQAKVEEAKVAKIEAEAAVAEAEAAYYVAQAKVQAAEEAYWLAVAEAEAAKGEADAAYRLAEAEKVLAEAMQEEAAAIVAMAEAEAAVAVIAADLEVYLLEVQTAMVEAKMAYEVAVKNLYAAQVSLTPAQKDYLAPFEAEVEYLEGIIFNVMVDLEDAADDLEAAIAELDEAVADSLGRIQAERHVADCEIALEEAKEALAEVLEFAALDPQILDWQAEMEKYEAERDALAVAVAQTYKAVNDFDSAPEVAEMNEAKAEFTAYTGREFVESSNIFIPYPTQAPTKLITWENEVYVPAILDEEGNTLYGELCTLGVSVQYGGPENYEIFQDLIKNVENAMEMDAKVVENLEKAKAKALESINYAKYVTPYTEAVAAVEKADYLAYLLKYENIDLEKVVADYNAAYEARCAAEKELASYMSESDVYKDETYIEKKDSAYAVYEKKYAEATVKYYAARQKAEDDYNAAYVEYMNNESINEYSEIFNNLASTGYDFTKYDAAVALLATEAATPGTYTEEEVNEADAFVKACKADKVFVVAVVVNEEYGYPFDSMYGTTPYERLTEEFLEIHPLLSAKAEAEAEWAEAIATYEALLNDVYYYDGKSLEKAFDDETYALYMDYYNFTQEILYDMLHPIEPVYETYLNNIMGYKFTGPLNKVKTAFNKLGYASEDNNLYAKSYYDTENLEIVTEYHAIDLAEVLKDDAFVEAFVENILKDAADNAIDYSFYNYLVDEEYDFTTVPSYEDYMAYYEAIGQNFVPVVVYMNSSIGGQYEYQRQIEVAQNVGNYTEEFEAYIAALEAYEVEFLAYVAEEEARIDAIEAEVEAFFAARAEEGKAINEAYEDALAAQSANAVATYAIMDALDTYVQYVTGYYGYTIEDYVEAIEAAVLYCEDLVESAEEDLYNAKKALEAINADEIDAVEVAQEYYDFVKEILDFMMEAYDEAVLALENAIAEVTGQAEVTE